MEVIKVKKILPIALIFTLIASLLLSVHQSFAETSNNVLQDQSNSNAASKPNLSELSNTQIYDIFERNINDYGVELVDWQGYIANPYVKLTVKPPKDAVYPVTITIKATGTSRLMMDLPSELSKDGAIKTLTFSNAEEKKDFKLAIHPDRIGGPNEVEKYRLTFKTSDKIGKGHTQNIPIRVWDQDDNKETNFPLHFDYRSDTITGYFKDEGIRNAAEQAVKDWFYFFDMEPFDEVPANSESIMIPGDNWENHVEVTNNLPYNGMWIAMRGLNDPWSTGFPADNGNYHTRNGEMVPGQIHRSLGLILEFIDGAVPFTSLNDEEWYLTDLYKVTDVYGLMMHEFGHSLAFHEYWSGMQEYKVNGGNDPDVINYQGHPVPLDSSYHIPGDEKYWDRISGQSGGWKHYFPTRRWMLTKLNLLVAENAGWKLNKNLTPFLKPEIVTTSLDHAEKGNKYKQTLSAKGGVPFYDWRIAEGSLPEGLSLDRFTGTISGKVSEKQSKGNYTFTVELRDYDEKSSPVTKTFSIKIR
jgi:hypothetical protein